MLGVAAKQAILDRYNELMMNYSDETAEEASKLQDEIDAQNLWDLESKVEMSMDALGCPPGDADVTTLSGGEKRRVALCKLLLEEPDLLLLDEPTNHLDAETVAWLEKHLELFPGAVLIVTHDRYFLDNVTGWILELDRGRGIPYEGNYTAYLEQEGEAPGAGEARGHRAPEGASSASASGWAARPRRAAPSRRRASRPMTSCSKANEARLQSRDAQIVIPPGPRLGDIVIEVEHLSQGL